MLLHYNKKVLTYLDVLDEECFVGRKVAIIGAGGIGIDVAHYLTSQTPYMVVSLVAVWLLETSTQQVTDLYPTLTNQVHD